MNQASSQPNTPASRPCPIPPRAGWAMLMVFALACTIRVGWILLRYASNSQWQTLQYPDEEAYWQIARSLAAGCGLVDEFGYRATYMPAYPAFLALFAPLSAPLLWARLIQASLGALAAPATYLLARQWLNLTSALSEASHPDHPASTHITGPRAWLPFCAATLVALDPFLLFFSGLLLTETFFTVSLLLFWGACLHLCRDTPAAQLSPTKKYSPALACWGGLMLLACLMLRPAAAILLPLAPLAILIGRRWDRRAWQYSATILLVAGMGLLPWAIRNHNTIGQFRWLTTRGGISLYDGLRREATGASNLADTKQFPQIQKMNELQWNEYFRQRAWAEAREDPGRVVKLALHKIARTWSPFPNVENYRRGIVAFIGGIWTLVVYLLALVGLYAFRRSIRVLTLLLLPIAGFTLLHAIFVGSVRYRLPWMPLLEVFAAAGALVLLERLLDNIRSGQQSLGEDRHR